ncbi:hypothetical protein PHYC_03753 [Phycisphaerales bacterium]|nr:hypothetical protein PHYC_03753 [Phycisphaerales bacterium]
MAIVLAGIDEAGYGPTLGPFCTGLSVFRAPDAADPNKAPDLWSLLQRGVCREPGRGGGTDRRGRVAVADSKQLKLSNSVRTTHPLVHLERGVLSFLRLMGAGAVPADDAGLFEALGVEADAPACYRGEGAALPVSMTGGELSLAAATVEAAMGKAGVSLLAMRADVTWEPEYNDVVRERNNKADAPLGALCRHLRRVWSLWGGTRDEHGEPRRLGIACDRLGGRVQYAEVLSLMLPEAKIEVVEETEVRSRYVLTEEGPTPRRAGIVFLSEGESAHLPVALASMIAKYVRELSMARFNAYWGARYRDARGGELKPTAGYSTDARRWLQEVGDVLSMAERRELVRIL